MFHLNFFLVALGLHILLSTSCTAFAQQAAARSARELLQECIAGNDGVSNVVGRIEITKRVSSVPRIVASLRAKIAELEQQTPEQAKLTLASYVSTLQSLRSRLVAYESKGEYIERRVADCIVELGGHRFRITDGDTTVVSDGRLVKLWNAKSRTLEQCTVRPDVSQTLVSPLLESVVPIENWVRMPNFVFVSDAARFDDPTAVHNAESVLIVEPASDFTFHHLYHVHRVAFQPVIHIVETSVRVVSTHHVFAEYTKGEMFEVSPSVWRPMMWAQQFHPEPESQSAPHGRSYRWLSAPRVNVMLADEEFDITPPPGPMTLIDHDRKLITHFTERGDVLSQFELDGNQ